MIKIIAKILFAIAIIWTLAFIFKIGNSFALSPEYKKEIYNNCYQDAKTSLGKKRAKQYCKCTSTMLDNKYSDEDILNIGQKSEAEQMEAFKFATNYCNKNANASSDVEMSKKIEESSNNIINFNKCYRIDWASNKGDPMKNFNSFDEMTEKFPVEDNMYNINLDNMTVTNLIVWKDEKIKEDLKQGFVTEKFKKEIRPITSNIGNIITAEDNDVSLGFRYLEYPKWDIDLKAKKIYSKYVEDKKPLDRQVVDEYIRMTTFLCE